MQRVLFVCTGNICRSPTAEAVFRAKAAQAGLNVGADSAGLAGYHIGEPSDERSRAHAEKRGYDMSDLRARRVTATDFEEFDLIIAMDRGHYRDLIHGQSTENRAKVRLMMDFASDYPAGSDVPDPYYGGARGFEDVLDRIEDAISGLINTLRQEQR